MVVEAYPSFVVTKVLKWATTLAEDQISEIMGIDRELVKLKNELMMLQNILEDAENKQLSNPYVCKWLEDLRFFALDAEDFLDELATEVAANMVRVKYTSPCANPDQFVLFRHKITHLMQMLDDIVSRKSDLNLMKLEEYSGQQEIATTMLMRRLEDGDMHQQELELIGRDTEKKYIINQLLGSNYVTDEDSESIVKIIPIVGMGGIGKTTLAQSICNELEVLKHFGFGKWVFVGENFDTVKVISKIISPHIDIEYRFPLDTMQNKLLEEVLTKKILIVLDDVCDIDQKVEEWKNLWTLLTRGKKGGCVIVTSRNHKILPVINGYYQDYKQLERLEDNHCWSIFEKNAFADGNSYNCHDFKSIGWEIVREKVKGVPLAAKMVGKSLLGKNIKVWESFLQNEEWFLSNEGDSITAALRFSYHHLPPHLKSCVNYCGTYPKAWRFNKKELILKWMALGFLEPAEVVNQRMEDTGETYFEDLLQRSFLEQNIYKQYVMHDLVHDLVLLVSSGECKSTSIDQDMNSWSKNLLNVSVASTQDLENPRMKSFGKLRSICCLGRWNEREFKYDDSEKFEYVKVNIPHCIYVVMFKCLNVLDLSQISIRTLPESVGTLIHLRYLGILFAFVDLPESVSDLYNLQTLKVASLHDELVVNLPDVGKLTNLRHLDVGIEISERIKGLKYLTSLQTLNRFVVRKAVGLRISELRELNQLRGELCISPLTEVDSLKEASEANMKNKADLRRLTLDWGAGATINSDFCSTVEILEGLQPHENLVHLEIVSYMGDRCPTWLGNATLTKLTHLTLTGCHLLESVLVPENVTHLTLTDCHLLESVLVPENVTDLVLSRCNKCESVELSENVMNLTLQFCSTLKHLAVPNNLTNLSLIECNNLKFFAPQLLPNLKFLALGRCPLFDIDATSAIAFPALESLLVDNSNQLISIVQRCLASTLQVLAITPREDDIISSYFNSKEVHWQDFTSLQQLDIVGGNMTFIPDEIHLLPYLRKLRLYFCQKLRFLPEMGLPKTLGFLSIIHCDELKARCQIGGPEWSNISCFKTSLLLQ